MSSLLQGFHALYNAACEIFHDILQPPLEVGERLSSGFLDLGDLSEAEDAIIDLANVCSF